MAYAGAQKQWPLGKKETLFRFEAWRHNLLHILKQDADYKEFLKPNMKWERRTRTNQATRGLVAAADVTAEVKCFNLELLLGQIANFCPVISRSTIINNSTCLDEVWNSIKRHYGFQTDTGAQPLDLHRIVLEPDDSPEDLYQKLLAFVESGLLCKDAPVTHYGRKLKEDEELTPSLENFTIVQWLYALNPDLPDKVKERYGTVLKTRTLASIRPEISQTIPSLLAEIEGARVLRTVTWNPNNRNNQPNRGNSWNNQPNRGNSLNNQPNRGNSSGRRPPAPPRKPECPLCKLAGRASGHFLTRCTYLPESDKQHFSRIRNITGAEEDCYMCATDDLSLDDEQFADRLQLDKDNHGESQPVPIVHAFHRKVKVTRSPSLLAKFHGFDVPLLLDSGAETNLVSSTLAHRIGLPIQSSSQRAFLADGITALEVVGETHVSLTLREHSLSLDALIVSELDVPVLAGMPFMIQNDITLCPAKSLVQVGPHLAHSYATPHTRPAHSLARSVTIRAPRTCTVWPGESLEVQLDSDHDLSRPSHPDVVLEPTDNRQCEMLVRPDIFPVSQGRLRIPNDTDGPITIQKNAHVAVAYAVTSSADVPTTKLRSQPRQIPEGDVSSVRVDPDHILPPEYERKFHAVNSKYEQVFDAHLVGYNGSAGAIKAYVNMGPVQPPQRRGRVPQYQTSKLQLLQEHFDVLETLGVLVTPESVGVHVEYVSPSFLVKKSDNSHRLVTAFSDIGKYSKPQPSLMPSVDTTLNTIGKWTYIIKADLTKAFFQIPLDQNSMRYCGVVTPYRGMRVYARAAMGMPGSETALEELMSRVLGDLLAKGSVTKLADDLFCGSDDLNDLLNIWSEVLAALARCDLKLSPKKTVICPQSTDVLGWIWKAGQLSTSSHRIAPLSTCAPPTTVKALRSFVGSIKVLGRVIPGTAALVAPFDAVTAGKKSCDPVTWTDELVHAFRRAQEALRSPNTITQPRPSDQIWIVTDGSTSRDGLGSTLYLWRNNKLHLGGFFSAKLKQHQYSWLPCEVEALSIAASITYFAPYIIESQHKPAVLTDSKPCVQAYEKLRRGEFSSSPRLFTFMAAVSRYQATVSHVAGSANLVSDFASRNAVPCEVPTCQLCRFVNRLEEATVHAISVKDVLSGVAKLPFANRPAWLATQRECPELRRVHAHLTQGTRPHRKELKIRDIKRYMNTVTISREGLLVVERDEPLRTPRECIVVPRVAVDGLMTMIHLRLDHPTRNQMRHVFTRFFYTLDLEQYLSQTYESCHHCASLRKLPPVVTAQSTETPPQTVCTSFAADVLKHFNQPILLLRETVTSYTTGCVVKDETTESLTDGLSQLIGRIKPANGPAAKIRVDPAPGLQSISINDRLRHVDCTLVIGDAKNANKNPVAEHTIGEFRDVLKRVYPEHTLITNAQVELICSRMNSLIRSRGLSAYEMVFGRDQFTSIPIPRDDYELIMRQHEIREKNHSHSEKSKRHGHIITKSPSRSILVGDLVYLASDSHKVTARPRYLVQSLNPPYCEVRKFTGDQYRQKSYRVNIAQCYKVFQDHTEPRSEEYDNSSDDELSQPHVPDPTVTVAAHPVMPPPIAAPTRSLDTDPHIPPALSEPEISAQGTPDLPDHSETIGVVAPARPHTDYVPSFSRRGVDTRPQRTRCPPASLADYEWEYG